MDWRALVVRKGSAEAEELSEYLREGNDPAITARRSITRLYLGGIAALAVVAAYQTGLIKKVPEPRLSFLDADRVDASSEAYETLKMPDAVLGLISYAVTLALVTKGTADTRSTHRYITAAAFIKIAFDAASGAALTAEQIVKHRALCSWCLGAAAASWLSLSPAWRELRSPSPL